MGEDGVLNPFVVKAEPADLREIERQSVQHRIDPEHPHFLIEVSQVGHLEILALLDAGHGAAGAVFARGGVQLMTLHAPVHEGAEVGYDRGGGPVLEKDAPSLGLQRIKRVVQGADGIGRIGQLQRESGEPVHLLIGQGRLPSQQAHKGAVEFLEGG